MLVHAHNRSIDHLHGGIMSSRQRIHDLVPEAALCGNETVVIVGAGNSSAQASLHLARYARKVIIVMRGERLNDSVSQYLVDRIKHTPNIEVLPNTEVKALHGERMLEAVTLRNRQTGDERTIETAFLFLCLGGVPNTDWAVEVGIIRDEQGYLVTGPDLRRYRRGGDNWKINREPYYLETSMPGVFAAGDVSYDSIKRLTSAVGEGAMAIAFVHRYLATG
jgi:thioredoxin reductase (NADPH)